LSFAQTDSGQICLGIRPKLQKSTKGKEGSNSLSKDDEYLKVVAIKTNALNTSFVDLKIFDRLLENSFHFFYYQ
jgi:hypothetical protein